MKVVNQIKRGLIALLFVASVNADRLVLPPGAEDKEGTGLSVYPFGTDGRVQQLYTADLFSSTAPVIEITSVAFRVNNSFFGELRRTYSNLNIQMSTTQKTPATLGDHPMSVWLNHGSDLMTAFQGSVTFDTDHPGGEGPAPFGVKITFQNPYIYNKQAGNLLLELTPGPGGPGIGGGTLDAFFRPGNSLVWGEVTTLFLATQFEFRTVPEPTILALGGLSVLMILFSRRKA